MSLWPFHAPERVPAADPRSIRTTPGGVGSLTYCVEDFNQSDYIQPLFSRNCWSPKGQPGVSRAGQNSSESFVKIAPRNLPDVIILGLALVRVGAVPRFVCEFASPTGPFRPVRLSQADIHAITGMAIRRRTGAGPGTTALHPGGFARWIIFAELQPDGLNQASSPVIRT